LLHGSPSDGFIKVKYLRAEGVLVVDGKVVDFEKVLFKFK